MSSLLYRVYPPFVRRSCYIFGLKYTILPFRHFCQAGLSLLVAGRRRYCLSAVQSGYVPTSEPCVVDA